MTDNALQSFACEIAKRVILEPSGGTLDFNRNSPTTGYMVGGFSWTLVCHEEIFDIYTIQDFLDAHKNLVTWPGVYVGWWTHNHKVYLDISEHIRTQQIAHELAQGRHEIAYWDVVNKQEIKL